MTYTCGDFSLAQSWTGRPSGVTLAFPAESLGVGQPFPDEPSYVLYVDKPLLLLARMYELYIVNYINFQVVLHTLTSHIEPTDRTDNIRYQKCETGMKRIWLRKEK